MEFELSRLAIVVLIIGIFVMLLLFYSEFGELLERDKNIQKVKDKDMYDALKGSSPSKFKDKSENGM